MIASRGSADVALGAEALWCDVVVFRQALVAGANAAALDLYRGDLLEGFSIAGISIELERWLEEERAVLKARAAAAAASLCKQAEGAGDLDLAVHWARRGLALSPDDESALRRLVRLLDRQGNRTGALRAVQEFARHALDELCAEPAAETQALVDEIRSRAQAHHVREPRALPSPAAHPTAEPPAAAPLISGGSGQHAPGVAALDDRAAHPWGTAALAVGVRLLGGLAETIVRLRDELESMGDASDGSPRRPDRKQA